jgi:hypothetical protein
MVQAAMAQTIVVGDEIHYPATWAGYRDEGGHANTSTPILATYGSDAARLQRLSLAADHVLADLGVTGTVYEPSEGEIRQIAIVSRIVDELRQRDARSEAAAVMGRKGGKAGKGSPARKAAAQHAIRTRWDRAKAAK